MIPRTSLSTRLILLLSLVLVLTFGTFAWVTVGIQREQFEEDAERFAINTSDLIRSGISQQMVLLTSDQQHRSEEILHAIDTAARQPWVRLIRIFDKRGVVRYSSRRDEISTKVDVDAEACIGCHRPPAPPLAELQGTKRIREFQENGNRMMGLTTPIENDARCWACHTNQSRVLGTLDIQMSLGEIDANVRSSQAKLFFWGLVSLLAVAAITAFCVWRFVHRPVSRLIEGTRRVGAGDLEHAIPTDTHDEIGELARSFNTMTDNLRGAQAKLSDWAHTLEERVEEKTAELRSAQQQVIQAEKLASVGKLSAVVAHEINNPLAGVLTYAKLVEKMLRREEIPLEKRDKMLKYLRTIGEETDRCGKIVKNLLAFSRQSHVELRPNDLHEVIEKCVFMVQHKLDLQSITLETRLGSDVPPVQCDANRIQQVLLAVLINAIEAMPEGGRVVITSQLSAPGQMVRLTVRDSGHGIPAEVLQHVFEPFTTTKEEGKGVGLGMSVVHGIITQHHGEVEVLSPPGEGVCVVIDLPLRQPRRTAAEDT